MLGGYAAVTWGGKRGDIRGMRAYELRATGLENLIRTERPPARPGAGEVLVRVRAASLNYRDLLIASGRYGRVAPRFPLIPLSDGAGEVVELGPNEARAAYELLQSGRHFGKVVIRVSDEDRPPRT